MGIEKMDDQNIKVTSQMVEVQNINDLSVKREALAQKLSDFKVFSKLGIKQIQSDLDAVDALISGAKAVGVSVAEAVSADSIAIDPIIQVKP